MIRYYKLFDLLQRRGLGRSSLIEIAGLTSPTVAKLGKGASVTTDTINKICAALNVQPGDIMEYIPEEKTEE